ncbi:MAG: hypothetical protein NZ959_06060 [Armatimonadetes bacterium]|nr:hypothetical protein [Armatimonadota bacterium]MDW8121233.1 hypothetical protein [Armatimonadota bacterium]
MLIVFDLEGPLTPTDHAYEVCALLPEGRRLFERLSRYDDLLTLEGRENYQAGDTLKLILPFLLVHGVTDDDLVKVSQKSPLTPGAKECVADIYQRGWMTGVISTAYQPHAFAIGDRLGIYRDMIVATSISFSQWESLVTEDAEALVLPWEERILRCRADDDEELKRLLDEFFWVHLIRYPLGVVLETPIMGGKRKTEALSQMAHRLGLPLSQCVFIGDSITDCHALNLLRQSNGLPIVFNGNEYALPYGKVGVASDNLTAVLPILSAFERGGWQEVQKLVEAESGRPDSPYQWLGDEDWSKAVAVHRQFRSLLRGLAASLG